MSISDQFGWSPTGPAAPDRAPAGRYFCTVSGYPSLSACERPPGARPDLLRIGSRDKPQAEESTSSPLFCDNWMSGMIAAAACDQKTLRASIAHHGMGHRGSLRVSVSGRRSGDARGIAQAVGEPVRPGTYVRITGHGSPTTLLSINAAVGKHRYSIQFCLADLAMVTREVDATLILRGPANGPVFLSNGRHLRTTVRQLA